VSRLRPLCMSASRGASALPWWHSSKGFGLWGPSCYRYNSASNLQQDCSRRPRRDTVLLGRHYFGRFFNMSRPSYRLLLKRDLGSRRRTSRRWSKRLTLGKGGVRGCNRGLFLDVTPEHTHLAAKHCRHTESNGHPEILCIRKGCLKDPTNGPTNGPTLRCTQVTCANHMCSAAPPTAGRGSCGGHAESLPLNSSSAPPPWCSKATRVPYFTRILKSTAPSLFRMLKRPAPSLGALAANRMLPCMPRR
jgi:hypothetical protein